MENNSKENIDEQPKVKIKRSRRRLYQTEVEERKTGEKKVEEKQTKAKKKSPEVVKAKVKEEADSRENKKPQKENEKKDRVVIGNNREEKAKEMIKKNMYWSAGIGLLPFPFLDLAALVALQVKMVKNISSIYGIPFREELGKSFILSLISGLNAFTLSWLTWRSFLKFVPGIAGLMGVVSSSAFAGGATFAVGKVFIQHFEMGGTLLNFNPAEVKQYFREQYEQGKNKIKEVK